MLVSAGEMLRAAATGGYAIGQFNINNLEWIKAILAAAEKKRSPLILGITESAARYMGGPGAVHSLVMWLLADMRITFPVALHLDHASEESCLQALGAGFSSLMFDGSKMHFEENLRICRKLAEICAAAGASLEAELGSPAGEEDGITGTGEHADPQQCAALAQSGITVLAAAIGNIHGEYPPDWPGLDLRLLAKIREAVNGLPLALHGGSGITEGQIRQAIELGICKINVNTECQIAFAGALRDYFAQGLDREPKGYNAHKILKTGMAAIMQVVEQKIDLFGCAAKA